MADQLWLMKRIREEEEEDECTFYGRRMRVEHEHCSCEVCQRRGTNDQSTHIDIHTHISLQRTWGEFKMKVELFS